MSKYAKSNKKVKKFQQRNHVSLENIKDIKKNQIEILELKNLMIERKNSIDWLNSRIKRMEEIISKLEDNTIYITQSKENRENKLEKTQRFMEL